MRRKMLVHTCCAPCLYYPMRQLEKENFEIYVYWYNPNIHGWREYNKRRMTLGYYLAKKDTVTIMESPYEIESWFSATSGFSGKDQRCRLCYRMRLRCAARTAVKKEMDLFTTTLLYSKFQNYDHIVEEGLRAASEEGVEFYQKDFRVGWKEGIEESKEEKIYRQEYCGCIYSETERYS